MVEDHAHGMFQVFELLGVDVLHLRVTDLPIFHQWKQDVCCQSLHFQVQLLGNLTLLQTLVNTPDVLAKGRVVVVLDTVVRTTFQEFGDICPFVAVHFVSIKYYNLFLLVDWRLLD